MSRSHALVRSQRPVLALSTLAASVALALMAAPNAHAFEFTSASGEVTGSFDTTLSIGGLWRMQDRESSLISIANGGTSRDPNSDDGNLKYDKGDMVSLAFKATHDLELNYQNFGAFFRGTYFYDHAFMHKSGMTNAARGELGRDAELLDEKKLLAQIAADLPANPRRCCQLAGSHQLVGGSGGYGLRGGQPARCGFGDHQRLRVALQALQRLDAPDCGHGLARDHGSADQPFEVVAQHVDEAGQLGGGS